MTPDYTRCFSHPAHPDPGVMPCAMCLSDHIACVLGLIDRVERLEHTIVGAGDVTGTTDLGRLVDDLQAALSQALKSHSLHDVLTETRRAKYYAAHIELQVTRMRDLQTQAALQTPEKKPQIP